MTSEVEICNVALSHIRGGSINSLDEASTKAQNCKLLYPLLRDQLLREVPWQFAHKIRALALTTAEPFNWVFAYQYPTDCLYINKLLPDFAEINGNGSSSFVSRRFDPGLPQPDLTAQIPYEILNNGDNKLITTNESDLRVDYRSKVTTPNLFDPTFVMMLAHLLASELAIPIIGATEGKLLRVQEVTLYQEHLKSATASTLNEQHHIIPDSEFVNVR